MTNHRDILLCTQIKMLPGPLYRAKLISGDTHLILFLISEL